MSVIIATKEMLKKTIGQRNIQFIKTLLYLIKRNFPFNRNIISTNSNYIESYKYIGLDKCNVFCGYYEVPIFNFNERYLLVHILPEHAKEGITDVRLGYIDIDNDYKINEFAKSKAWCWQQGSRLRWSNKFKNTVYFNDYLDNKYCSIKFDINKHQISETFETPFYDIDKKETFALSCNFDRLQRLRPGYGYSNTNYECEDKAPKNDGIFLFDIKNHSSKLIISLNNLAERADPLLEYFHYVNHISISPDGKKFMFFHIMTKPNSMHLKVLLYVYSIENQELTLLEKKDLSSHYCWLDDNNILIVGQSSCSKNFYYRIYNTSSKSFTSVTEHSEYGDGHPTKISENLYLSDSYPDKSFFQHLLVYSYEKGFTSIASMIHSPSCYNDKRCDLHPKLSPSKRQITVDTIYKDGLRGVLIFNMKSLT